MRKLFDRIMRKLGYVHVDAGRRLPVVQPDEPENNILCPSCEKQWLKALDAPCPNCADIRARKGLPPPRRQGKPIARTGISARATVRLDRKP